MMLRGSLLLMCSIGIALLGASPAFGTTPYTSVAGTNYSFTGIQETSSFGDPEPLFGQPIGFADQLLFFPLTFSASAAGAGGFDQTGSQLQLQIAGNTPADIINTVLITEFGDVDLSGLGTGATGAFVSMSGALTVTATTGGPIAPVIINWVGTFTQDLFGLPGDSGVTLWTGSVSIDVASAVPNATVAFLSYDNDLIASSEDGTTAIIQKKVVPGPSVIIEVIPEPTTGLLLATGLLFAIRSRRR